MVVPRIGLAITASIFVFIANIGFAYPLTPSPELTQGELCSEENVDFAGYRYKEHIPYCQRNVSWVRREKIYDLYNIPSHCRHRFTVDHFIPLALGGDNSDTNLWPEHKLVKATRPFLEQNLYLALVRGEITQSDAIQVITEEKTKANTQWMGGQEDNCDQPMHK